jgi:hypothetical protein
MKLKILATLMIVKISFAMNPLMDAYKFCNYDSLSKAERAEIVSYAFDNYLPSEYKNSLAKGVSNYAHSTGVHQKQLSKCKKDCDKLIRKNDTILKYDITTAYNAIVTYVNSNAELINLMNSVCKDFSKTKDRIIEEYNPSKKVAATNDLSKRKQNVTKLAGKLGIKLHEKRVHNPKKKVKGRSLSDGIVVTKKDCVEGSEVELSIVDKLQYKSLEVISGIVGLFAPKSPSAFKKTSAR